MRGSRLRVPPGHRGPRRAEVAAMQLEDVDFGHNVVWVRGRGGRDRAVPFGRNAARALDRYLRARARHRQKASAALWIGPKGPITDPASPRSFAVVAYRPASRVSTLTSSATPSRTCGAPPAAKEPTSCASPAGAPRPCCAATAPPQPTLAPGRRTVGSHQGTGSNHGCVGSLRRIQILHSLQAHLLS